MPLNAEYAIDGVNGEEAICGGLITKVSAKKGLAGQNLSGRARAIFTRAVNLRGFPPGVPTGVGKNSLSKLGLPLHGRAFRIRCVSNFCHTMTITNP
jgi:hypothetical protein